jgi:hypothetical protein
MYEHNRRQPSLKILLAYARIAAIPLEQIVDDDLELQLSNSMSLPLMHQLRAELTSPALILNSLQRLSV